MIFTAIVAVGLCAIIVVLACKLKESDALASAQARQIVIINSLTEARILDGREKLTQELNDHREQMESLNQQLETARSIMTDTRREHAEQIVAWRNTVVGLNGTIQQQRGQIEALQHQCDDWQRAVDEIRVLANRRVQKAETRGWSATPFTATCSVVSLDGNGKSVRDSANGEFA